MDLRLKIHRISIIAFIGIAIFYYWTTFSSVGRNIREEYKPFDHFLPKGIENDFYNSLTHSLLKGQLFLDIKVPAELASLTNPYDPKQRKILNHIRNDGTIDEGYLYDASLYKGKYYLYFGITPVILIFAPFHLITGIDLPVPTALLTFILLALVIQISLLRTVLRDHFHKLGNSVFVSCVLICAFCNPIALLLRRPTIYELAIGCALFLNTCLVYIIYKIINRTYFSYTLIVILGIIYSLLIGSRPNFIFISPAILLFFYFTLKIKYQDNINLRKTILLFSIPVFFIGALIAIYNYLRFDSFTEFGVHYQLAGIYDQTKVSLLSVKNIVYNLYAYLITIPTFNIHYPYINFSGWEGLPNPIKEPVGFLATPMLGIITCLPILGVPLWAFIFRPGFIDIKLKYFVIVLYFLFFLSFMSIISLAGNCVRYYFDFSLYLAIISVIFTCKLEMWLFNSYFAHYLRLAYNIVIVLTVFISVIASIELYSLMNNGNPRLHTQIAYYLEELNPFIIHIKGNKTSPVYIQFSADQVIVGKAQPVWSSGFGENSEHVFVYFPDKKNICIGYAYGYTPLSPGFISDINNRENYFLSKAFPIHAGENINLAIDLQTVSNTPSDTIKNLYHIIFNNINVFNIQTRPSNIQSNYYFIGTNPTTTRFGFWSDLKILSASRIGKLESERIFSIK